MWNNPDDATLRKILETSRSIAVIGLSPNPVRDSHRVTRTMQKAGYDIIGVNPVCPEILGVPCYPSMADVPPERPIDIVNIFRRPEFVARHVDEAIARGGVRCIWMQLGVVDEAAARKAQSAGLTVVMDLCIMVEHRILFGR